MLRPNQLPWSPAKQLNINMILAARGMFLSRLTAQTIAPCTIRAEVVKVVVKTNNNRDNRFFCGTKITAFG